MAKVYNVTMKDVAERVGVSRMTVSLALRGQSKISAATTQKVQEAAKELGYNPNPYLSALGAHIRSSKQKGLQAQLAYLCHKQIRSPSALEQSTPFFEEEFYLGAVRRAEALGYGIDRIQLTQEALESGRLNQTLTNRGIIGLIVWRHYINHFDWNLDWDRFAICTMGVSQDEWDFHSVECDRQRGMVELVKNIRNLGYKRPGLVMVEGQDKSHHHIQRSVISDWQLQLPPSQQVPHLIEKQVTKERFLNWLDQHKPDLVIGSFDCYADWILESGRSIPADIGFSRPQITERKDLSGIRYNHGAMGEASVDVIAGQINCNERGLPRIAKNVLISGEWQSGESLRPQA
jgi:LacI family transcriptional regulator